jgi:hypothetical protein
MKNLKICHPEARRTYFALLLLFLSIVAPAQTPVGTINLDGKEVEIFYKIKGSTPVVVPDPVIVSPPVSGATISGSRYDLIRGFVISVKINNQTPTAVSWDGQTYYPFSVIYQNKNNSTPYWFKVGGKVLKLEIKTGNEASQPSIVGSADSGAVTIPPIIEQENNQVESTPVILPDNQTPVYADYGKTGVVYTSKKRGKLILPSHNNSGGPQIFKVSRNGTEIYSYNRPAGWQPESAYWGNHGKESQFAVEPGNLNFYFKNTHTKPVIVGFTTGNAYSFYDIKGELEKTNYFKELEPGEECSFSQYFENNTMYEAINRNWNNTSNTFQLTCPFYENGVVTTDRILEGNGPNGFTVDENKTSTHKFYKQSNPSINTTIRFTTKSIYEEPTFEILEINDLYIKPEYTMLTCYSVTQGKVFNNDSNGYVWSKHYKTF